MTDLTVDKLKSLVHYDPVVGLFVRKTKASQAPRGSFAVNKDSKGYIRVRVAGDRFTAHRLAWFYMTGEWPEKEVDHKNRIRTDNRWSNLRQADEFNNKRNTSAYRSNKIGFKGVSWHVCSKKWRARIRLDGKEVNLGLYDTPEEANAAYARAAQARFGEFARSA